MNFTNSLNIQIANRNINVIHRYYKMKHPFSVMPTSATILLNIHKDNEVGIFFIFIEEKVECILC